MTIIVSREEPVPDSLNHSNRRSERVALALEVLTLAALVLVSLCGLPLVASEARAGGGGGGGGCSGISYVYDCAGRLTCIYDECTGQGVSYTYDYDGNIKTVGTATSCSQNTCSMLTDDAFASLEAVPAFAARPADDDLTTARLVSAHGEKLNHMKVSVRREKQSEKKPLMVSLR